MKHALGIDIGSTTVKVTVIDESYTILFFRLQTSILQIAKGTLQTYYLKPESETWESDNHPILFGGNVYFRVFTYSVLSGSSLCGKCIAGL